MVIPRLPGSAPQDLSRPLEEIRFLVLPEQDGERLDRALCRQLHWRSRSSIHRLIRDGLVDLRGRRARPSVRVHAGDEVCVRIPQRAEEVRVAPDDDGLAVLHEDRWIVAVDKPAGIAVHPAGRRVHGTLIHWLHTRYRNPDEPRADVVPRLLHRLDRETSGVVTASLDEVVHPRFYRQFEEREVRKTYLAVTHGAPPADSGVVDLGIGPDHESPIRLKMRAFDDGRGQAAWTEYRVLRRGQGRALVELRPRTGRTHQLRVHMDALGCPLVGDKIYGAPPEVFLQHLEGEIAPELRAGLVLDRHALHAARLELHHPVEDRPLVLDAPLPAELDALV